MKTRSTLRPKGYRPVHFCTAFLREKIRCGDPIPRDLFPRAGRSDRELKRVPSEISPRPQRVSPGSIFLYENSRKKPVADSPMRATLIPRVGRKSDLKNTIQNFLKLERDDLKISPGSSFFYGTRRRDIPVPRMKQEETGQECPCSCYQTP